MAARESTLDLVRSEKARTAQDQEVERFRHSFHGSPRQTGREHAETGCRPLQGVASRHHAYSLRGPRLVHVTTAMLA
jgi:hypothetical protein